MKTDDEIVVELCTMVTELKSCKKKAEKKDCILRNQDKFSDAGKLNEFEMFFKMLLDPAIVTGLSSKKIKKDVLYLGSARHDFCSVCEYLKEHNTGTDMDVAVVRKYIQSKPDCCKDFLERFFTKNLPIGLEAKSLNEYLDRELIHIHEVQQGYPIDKYKWKPGEWFSLSQKLNGNRGTYTADGKIVSRQGQKFSGLDHIIKEIQILGLGDYVLDGELIRKNIDGISDEENFRIGTGILNSDAKEKTEIKFVVFEILSKKEFDAGKSNKKYKKRYEFLSWLDSIFKLFEDSINPEARNDCLEVVPIVYQGTDRNQIDVWLQYAEDHDWEGLMCNRDVPYYCKRHNGCLKVKRFYAADLRVIGVEEGKPEGKYAGTLGALVVDYKGNAVKIGGGYSDALRNQIWANPDYYIGKIIEVKYKEVTRNKKDGFESLQFADFVRFRDDKTEVSYG